MSKIEDIKSRRFGWMTKEQLDKLEVTERGFVYKGEVLLAIRGLLDEVQVDESVVDDKVEEVVTETVTDENEIFAEKRKYNKKKISEDV